MDKKKVSPLLPQSRNVALLILVGLTILSLGLLIAFVGFALTNK